MQSYLETVSNLKPSVGWLEELAELDTETIFGELHEGFFRQGMTVAQVNHRLHSHPVFNRIQVRPYMPNNQGLLVVYSVSEPEQHITFLLRSLPRIYEQVVKPYGEEMRRGEH